MIKTRFVVAAVAGVLLAGTGAAFALCGDVTGDGEKQVSDALAVLRSAVGQNVQLICEDSGPSRMRFYNDFQCASGSQTATATFNGFSFSAGAFATSAYQTVDRTSITNMQVKFCGLTFDFAGPLNLPPNRKLTFVVVLVDPDIYPENFDAQFVIQDDGEPAALLADAPVSSSQPIATGFGRIVHP